jgi:tetratricopeptide (TPR) repeat protein
MRRANVTSAAAFIAIWALAAPVLRGAGGQNWTDRAEYDKVLAIQAERSLERRLQLLEEWKQKYPASELGRFRSELLLGVYQDSSDWQHAFAVSREMLAATPDNMAGAYWTALLGPGTEASPEVLTVVEKAANTLLDPSGPSAKADYAAQKPHVQTIAHRALGWAAWQRGDLDAAERELTAVLKADEQSVETSLWLGLIQMNRNTPEKQSAALWHLARAAFSDREGALPAGRRRDVRQALDVVYLAYHGSADGLQDIATAAKRQALPADGFLVETAASVAQRREREELRRTNPQLADWLDLRGKLEAPDGEKYFAEALQAKPLAKFKGKIVRCEPDRRPKEIILGISAADREEVKVQVASPLGHCPEAGTEIEFEADGVAFTREPFLLTVQTSADRVTGLPGAASGRRK